MPNFQLGCRSATAPIYREVNSFCLSCKETNCKGVIDTVKGKQVQEQLYCSKQHAFLMDDLYQADISPALALTPFFSSQMLVVSLQRKIRCLLTWGEQQTWYVWQMPTPLYLPCSHGNGWWEPHTHRKTGKFIPLNYISFICLSSYYLPSSYHLSLAFINAQMPFFTGSNYPSTPPPLASHSAQIQKNSFHYGCVTKGHIRQCGVVSVSTDAFCIRAHLPAEESVPLLTCITPSSLCLSCCSLAILVSFLTGSSSENTQPIQVLTVVQTVLPSLSKTGRKHPTAGRGAGIEG